MATRPSREKSAFNALDENNFLIKGKGVTRSPTPVRTVTDPPPRTPRHRGVKYEDERTGEEKFNLLTSRAKENHFYCTESENRESRRDGSL